MSRSWALFLHDLEEAARKVVARTQGVSFERFVGDDILYDAVVRNLEVIGEAAKGIPVDVRARCPEVDWRRIAGLRDILSHAYFAIDNETLWDVITKKVPQLLVQVEELSAASRRSP